MPSALRVVIVEDEPELLENLIVGLSAKGFQVSGAPDGAALDRLLVESPADVFVLDLGLPGEDGITIARRLHQASPNCGIILLTASNTAQNKVNGMESGADNYLVKPVDLCVLAATINSLARRLKKVITPGWDMNGAASSLKTPKGVSVSLTAQECILLNLLIDNAGRNISRSEILQELGQPDDVDFYPRLEVMISRLRSKVGKADPASPLPLKARHSMGYIFLLED